jgi:DNA-binding MarR family transcriptional regulator
MNAKEETIRHMNSRLMRIINKHVQTESIPISVGDNVRLSPGEIRFIQTIGENEGANVMTLGKRMGITKSAVSQMVGKLGKKGFVVKRPAADNNKETLVFLTPTGNQAYAVHKEFHERHLHNLIDRLGEFSDTQIATAAMILSAVETVVDERMAEVFGKRL